MPAFTNIPNALVAVGAKPFATTIQALRDNPIAIAEDDPTAPKVKQKRFMSAVASTITFTGLGDYSGVSFEVHGYITGNSNFQIQYSTDGGTSWSTAATIVAVTGTNVPFTLFGAFDFATGQAQAAGGLTNTAAVRVRGVVTVAGSSLAINAIRFLGPTEMVIQLQPNGGTV